MADFPDAGKIQQGFFNEIIFPQCGKVREEVIVGSQYGVDVSVVKLQGGMAMAMTSDPLTLIPHLGLRESAWLSVQILANDMVTTGFAPMYAQFILNLPVSITSQDFNEYWNYIHKYCDDIGIAITGGHTGQVVGQNSTVAGGGTMITIAPEADILTSNKAKPDNAIIVTKSCALTASSILAMSFPETVKSKAGSEIYDKACETFYQTSSLKDGLIAAMASEHFKEVTAMHDVTEGGVLGAIYEMAAASDCGAVIINETLPIREVEECICNLFEIDPRYVVGAGSMIIAVEDSKKEYVLKRLKDNNIPATVVGYFTEKEKGKLLITDGDVSKLFHYGLDAYWNAFYRAYYQHWK